MRNLPLTFVLCSPLRIYEVHRDVHVQIIRPVITHCTICFYSPNTLFLKNSVHQLIPFIYFSCFLCKDCFFSKNTLHNRVKMNCTMCNYTPYNLYMDVPITVCIAVMSFWTYNLCIVDMKWSIMLTKAYMFVICSNICQVLFGVYFKRLHCVTEWAG